MYIEKEYKKQYYQSNKKKYAERDRQKYLANRDKILARRRELLKLESPEQRQKSLEYHKLYRQENKQILLEKSQTDKARYNHYISSAKRRNYKFELTFDEFSTIFNTKCSYCGESKSRGVDRIDNTIGYTLQNSTSCCAICNKMKWRYEKSEFITHVMKIASYQK